MPKKKNSLYEGALQGTEGSGRCRIINLIFSIADREIISIVNAYKPIMLPRN
jgi:hypothetical protein